MPKSRDFLLVLFPGFSERSHPGIFWSRDKQKLMIPGFLIPGSWVLNYPGIKKSRDWNFQKIPGVNDCKDPGILASLDWTLLMVYTKTFGKIETVNKAFLFWNWQRLKKIFFRNKTLLFFKMESWNFQVQFEIEFRETLQNFNSIRQPIKNNKKLSE